MGWSGGTEVMESLIETLNLNEIEHDTRVEVYRDMITSLEDRDWDCADECLGQDDAYDEAHKEICGE